MRHKLEIKEITVILKETNAHRMPANKKHHKEVEGKQG